MNKRKIYCKDYDFECCKTCHDDDTTYINYYKGFEISHCCGTLSNIEADILKHLEPKENDCQ